jgi:hypothetical protein
MYNIVKTCNIPTFLVSLINQKGYSHFTGYYHIQICSLCNVLFTLINVLIKL